MCSFWIGNIQFPDLRMIKEPDYNEIIDYLGDIASSLSSSNNLADLALKVETILEKLIEFEHNGLYLFDPIENKLKLFHAKGFTEEERQEAESTAMMRHPGKVFREVIELYIPDVDSDPSNITQSSKRSFDVKSRLYLPVMKNKECIGAFGIVSSKINAFTNVDRQKLSFVCNLAGIAYQNILANMEVDRNSSRLSALITNLKDGILVENELREIILTNIEFCNMFSIPVLPDDLIGQDCSKMAEDSKYYFDQPEKFMNRIVQILKEKKVVLDEVINLADGRVFERDYIPIFSNSVYYGNLWKYRDITEKELYSKKLIEQKHLSDAVSKATNILLTNTDVAASIPAAIELVGKMSLSNEIFLLKSKTGQNSDIEFEIDYLWNNSESVNSKNNEELRELLINYLSGNNLNFIEKSIITMFPDELDKHGKNVFEMMGIKSLVIIPVVFKSRIWGILLFSNLKNVEFWIDYNQSILVTFATSIAGALSRHESLEKLKESQKALNEKIEALNNSRIELEIATESINHMLIHQSLLADISQKFNFSKDIPCTINESLKYLGEHTGVSRVYIFEDSTDGNSTNNTYEWCNEGITPQIDELQAVPYEIIPSWKKILDTEGKIFSTNIRELPSDIYQILEPQEIKSILVFPLYVQNRFCGFMGFDECNIQRVWNYDEIELLRAITNIISSTIERDLLSSQLAENQLQFKLAIENTHTGIWDWNIITNNIYVNEMGYNLLGYESNKFQGNSENWMSLMNHEELDYIKKEMTDHLSGKSDIFKTEHRMRNNSGKWIWVIDTGKVIEFTNDGKPKRAIGTLIDITERKRAEEALRMSQSELENKVLELINSQKELEQATGLLVQQEKLATLGVIAGSIAHEINSPLGAVLNSAERLLEKKLPKEIVDKNLNLIINAATSSKKVVEKLLLSTRHSSTDAECNFNQLINDWVELYGNQLNNLGIDLSVKIKDQIIIPINYSDMNQVITNIVLNARDSLVSANEIKQKTIQVYASVDKEGYAIKVHDNGPGIDKNIINRIFEAFITSKEEGKGTGLGLWISKTIIEKNGGNIIAENTGKGALFTIIFRKK